MSDLAAQLQASLGTDYRLGHELGGGGMSRVFLADEIRFNRRIVVKLLDPNLAAGVSADRFEREIRLVAALQQANIVPLIDSGEADGIPYYTMPYVDGLSLRARLERDGRLAIGDTVSIARDIARALAYAHAHDVVHRDIKPDNILLSGGAAVVTDFGIAKAIDAATRGDRPAGASGALTAVGASIGTPAYMAPEQAAGDPATDARADIYALGCVMYEMLTGHPPFTGRTAHQLVAAHMTEAPPPLSGLRADCPPALASLVMRCIEKNPDARPFTAGALLADLDAIGPAIGPARRGVRQRVLIGAAALVGAAALFVAVRSWRVTGDSMQSVAVLPFANVGGDSTQEYFSDGIADEVSNAIAQLPNVRVAARSSAAAFKGKRIDPIEIGTKLHVAGLLEGTVRRVGTKLRVTTDLVSTHDGLSVWSHAYERDASQAPSLQQDITDGVVGGLRVQSTARSAAARPTRAIDPAAYDANLRGRYLVARGSRADLEHAVEFLRQATARDPLYSDAFANLSEAYGQLSDAYAPPNEAEPKALAAAERAVALDSNNANAHAALASVLANYVWDWPRAQHEVDRALSLNPSEPSALFSRMVLDMMRSNDSATMVADAQRVVQVDPLNPFAHSGVVSTYAWAGSADSAISEYRQTMQLSPGFIYLEPNVDDAYRLKGMLRDALAVNDTASRQIGHPTSGLVITLAAMGRRAEALAATHKIERAIAQGTYVPPETVARCYAALGDHDAALAWLRKGVEGRSAFSLVAYRYPEFRTYGSDPRYVALLRTMHLPMR